MYHSAPIMPGCETGSGKVPYCSFGRNLRKRPLECIIDEQTYMVCMKVTNIPNMNDVCMYTKEHL